MSKRFFGTDGIRGTVGKDPMSADFAIRLASAAAQVLVPAGGTVLIGKDTRLSGYMFESALEAGFVAAGADVLLLGPLPTPGIAYLTQCFEAKLGVVISASHNRFYDNGIKFFDGAGAKLTDEVELEIERYLGQPAITLESQALGKAKRIDTARVRYQEFCASTFPDDLDLHDVKVVFDGANGAGYKCGPRTLTDLGAEVIPIGCSPNGRNINDGCGSTHPELLELTGLVPGSVPPFGPPVLELRLVADPALLENEKVAFNAGSLTTSIIMASADYERVSGPNGSASQPRRKRPPEAERFSPTRGTVSGHMIVWTSVVRLAIVKKASAAGQTLTSS